MSATIAEFIKRANDWAAGIQFATVSKSDIIREMNILMGHKMQIWVTVEQTSELPRTEPFRVLISVQDGPFATELQINCNPILIEIAPSNETGARVRLLALGSERLVRYNYRTVKDYLPLGRIPEKAVINPVYEGTVITIYWYRDRWAIATSNGFDVTNYEWITEGVSYGDALAQFLPRTALDSLNRKWCYTFGFRHEAFHPIKNDPMCGKIWFMSRTNTRSCRQINIRTLPQIFPVMTMRQIDLGAEFGKSASVKRLISLCQHAYLDCANNGRFNYGYIIRIGNSAPILCESTLLSFVRRAFYQIPRIAKNPVNAVERRNWILLSAFLTYDSDLLEWWQLADSFRDELKIICGNMQKLRTCIIAALSDQRYADHLLQSAEKTEIEKLGVYYYNSLKRHVKKGIDNEILVRDRTVEEKNLMIMEPLLH